ncbi:MAG TPA: glycosyltransferase [Thermoanaerobaculia bacterium]|jgi:glycosyltransferase involved in cell wall biosynthesis|nr:glycosyltransferase [Thermoanaerobaculia bacterium]
MILSMTGGGAERQLSRLAPELSGRGHDVHLAFVYPGVNSERLDGRGCTLHHLAVSGSRKSLLPAKSFSLVRRLRPDVLQTWLIHMDIVGGATARMLGVPWVMSERSAALTYPKTLLNRARLALGKRADLIVPNSPGGAEYWTAHGVELSHIEIVPNFVTQQEIESANGLRDSRIAEDDELLLYIGRLSPEKNIPALIDAMRHVCRVRELAKLAICGEGPMLTGLTAQARAAGLEERIVFAGFVPDIASWLKRSRAVVAVSLVEGHPSAVLEAMAAGVPVVVSDIPAYRSLLNDDSASFVPAGDPLEIAAALVRTLKDRRSAGERAARAKEGMRSLSLEVAVTRYEDIYRRLLAGRGTR